MKKTLIPMALAGMLCAGCSSAIAPMGGDTYMVQRGGWPHMNGFAMEQKCLKAANRFCVRRGKSMVVVSAKVTDGHDFVNNASCELVFKATPTNTLNQISK